MTNLYFGKYKAQVIDINDPDKLNRIKVKCPLLFGDHPSGWCVPCVPMLKFEGDIIITDSEGHRSTINASQIEKLITVVPKKGDYVWIEFEQGLLSKPIYVGTWRVK